MPVRAARADDAEAIARLFGQLGYPSTQCELRARLLDTGDAVRTLVAEREGRVVGIVVVNLIAPLHVAAAERWYRRW